MSEPSAFGFGQFVPGFDFLQNLSKTASQAQPAGASGMPGMASWVAPTLSIEDIDKRIQELKSVLFWLEQNTTALKATIQAMEVQKMTLTTLQSMNVNMADLAKAFTANPPVTEPAAPEAAPATGSTAGSAPAPKPSLFTPKAAPQAQPDPEAQADTATPAEASEPAPASADATATDAGKPAVDPMQWWGALTQQFQGIAAAALKDVAGEAMKAGMAAKTASKAAAKRKAPTPRKAATGSKGQAAAAPSRGKPAAQATATPRKTARVAPVKATRAATQPTTKSTTKSTTVAPRNAAKK